MRFYCKAVFFLVLLLGLPACSPTFNWREVVSQVPPYVALFPAKPAQLTRTVRLGQFDLPLTLRAAEVNGLYFAVGTVPLTADTLVHAETLQKLMATALASNAGVFEPEMQFFSWLGLQALQVKGLANQGDIAVLNAQNQKGEAESSRSSNGFVEARFFTAQGYVFEVFVMSKNKAPPPDVVEQWFNGFRLGVQAN